MGWLETLFSGKSAGTAIKDTLGGVGDLSKDLRQAITGEMSADKKAELSAKLMELESTALSAQAQIIIAEANGGSWLQRNWRPMIMIWFAGLIGAHWLGFTPKNLTTESIVGLLDIVKLGVGGYVIGRSSEKVVKTLKGSGL